MFGLPGKTLSLIIATCTLLTGCQHGPNPADTVRNAYGWYLRELKSGVNPLEQKRAELKEFVTDNFLASLDNMRSELEASPLMDAQRSEEHTSELQSRRELVCRLLLEKKNKNNKYALMPVVYPDDIEQVFLFLFGTHDLQQN